VRDQRLDTTGGKLPCAARAPLCFGERFEVESLVGSGGQGMVYRARDRADGQLVALKVLHRTSYIADERFAREAEALARLAHPAIVRYVGHGTTAQGEAYLAMEWLDGETLAECLFYGNPARASVFFRAPAPPGEPVHTAWRETLAPAVTARMGSRILQALALAHGQGIVHRDIKPSNLFLPRADLAQVKLLDFGIARMTHDEWQVTRPGVLLGTPPYMAPEQLRGGDAVDKRADVFSLGCVLFECLLGEAPCLQLNPTQVNLADQSHRWSDAVSKALAPESSAVPQPLRALLERMLAIDPAARPDDAEKLSAELAAAAEALLKAGPVPRRPQRHRTLSGDEQRIAAVVFVSGIAQESGRGEAALRELFAAHSAQVERTADGSLALAFAGHGIPADLAAQAARAALRLGAMFPGASLAMSTNRADFGGRLSPGDAADAVAHASRTLAATPAGTIHVDVPTARLLESRFELQTLADGAFRLLSEKAMGELPRTLMGKALPCFGREREIALLEVLWEEACEASAARAMLMTAPAGGGKSRVRHEFCERISRKGRPFGFLLGRGDPMRDAAPFALLGPALRVAAGIAGDEPEPVMRERLAAHVTRFVPEKQRRLTATFMGEIANLPFPDDDSVQLQAARRDARLMADQKLSAWLGWLEAECAHQPVLLVLEDLHWGDAPTVNFVDAALRVLCDKPLMVLALSRPEVDRRFPGLWSARNLLRENLAPLAARACRRMVEHVAGELPETSARWIVDRAQGNPFYLQELLRVAAEGGKVGDDSNLPDTVLGMVQARLDGFGPDAKLVLRAASVFGQAFRPEGVKALLDGDRRKDVERWLGILEKQEILFARPGRDRREYAFQHALLRQAVYDTLPAAEKRLGHLLAGQYLEQIGERDGAVLADHFEKAGESAGAIRWLAVAAEQALDANDAVEAVARVERALTLGAAGEEACKLRVIEARARYWRGEYPRAEVAARAAVVSSDARTRLAALTALFDALGPQAKYGEIAARFAEVERPAEPELLNAWLECVVCAAAYLGTSGDYELHQRSLALLEEFRDRLEPMLVARAEFMRGCLARDRGNYAQAIAHYERAARHYENTGLRLDASVAHANMGICLGEVGQLERAEACFRRVLDFGQRMDLKHLLGGGLAALANMLAYRSKLEESRAFGRQALAVTCAHNDRRFQGVAEIALSVTEYLAANHEQAEHYARAAMATWQAVPAFQPFAVALLARALLAQGRIAEALPLAREAYAALEKMGAVDDGEATIRLALAECLAAAKDEAAPEAVAATARWLLARADKLGNPGFRESFLTRIPEHRRILELTRDFGIPGLPGPAPP